MNILMLLTKPVLQDGRVLKEARSLMAAGHQVTVLEWARHEPDAPEHEEVDGLRIVRVLDRLARLGSPTLRNPGWWRLAVRTASALHAEHRFDAVHCHDLDTLVPGVRLKRRHAITLVYDAHEIFSYMIEEDHGSLVAGFADRLERRLLKHVDRLITVNDAMAEHYRSLGVDHVVTVQNCAELPPSAPRFPEGDFTVAYVGVLLRNRFFPEAVHAIGAIEDTRFVIAGKQEGRYHEVEAAAREYGNVEFLGTIPASEVMGVTARAHVILCLFDPQARINRIGSPNKLYEAMAAGRPLIATAGTFAGDFVTRHAIGLAVGYDAASVQEAIRALRDDRREAAAMGRRARKLAETEYHWAAQAERLVDVYRGLEGRT